MQLDPQLQLLNLGVGWVASCLNLKTFENHSKTSCNWLKPILSWYIVCNIYIFTVTYRRTKITNSKKRNIIKVLIIAICTTNMQSGTRPGKKLMFGGCLYTLWVCMDHVVIFVHPKQKWYHLLDNFPQQTKAASPLDNIPHYPPSAHTTNNTHCHHKVPPTNQCKTGGTNDAQMMLVIICAPKVSFFYLSLCFIDCSF